VVNATPKAQPAQAARPASTNALNIDPKTLPIAAGGALALLALGGTAAVVAGRRRRRREQEWADAETLSYEPFETATAPEAQPEPQSQPVHHVEEAAAAAPAASAFAWGDRPQRTEAGSNEQDDRKPGETWVERAYRGPTPNNPSVSLRNRLSRAAFFDKREREVAAGTAEPVHGGAGLPGAMAGERELA
jgi:hypothetical protein